MNKIIMGFSYNGKYFKGWQKQKNILTLQEYIEIILSLILGYNVNIISSGRTDKGVHSIEQIINFNIKKNIKLKYLINSINYYIKINIKILWAQNIPLYFNSRKKSIIRNYRYIIYNNKNNALFLKNKIFYIKKNINNNKINNIKKKLIGMKNYNFCRTINKNIKNTIKYIFDIKIFKYNKFIIFDISANSFLYNMIRYLIGFLIIKQNLIYKNKYKIIAPAYGLYFIKSYYPKKFFIKYNKINIKLI